VRSWRSRSTSVALLALAILVLLTAVASAQEPGSRGRRGWGGRSGGGGGSGGFGGPRMERAEGTGSRGSAGTSGPMGMLSAMMDKVVAGHIADVNPAKGYVQVRTIPMGTNRIVLVTDQTKLTKLEDAPLDALKVGDEVTVSGVPLQLHASALRIGRPVGLADLMMGSRGPGPTASPPGAPPVPASAPKDAALEKSEAPAPGVALERKGVSVEPRRYATPRAEVTGVVVSTSPLTLKISDELSVTVSAAPDAKLRRPVPATKDDLAAGTPLVAFGTLDADNYLQATEVRLGETLDLRSFASVLGM